MFSWAITFLIFALIAGLFGFSGLAGTAANIAWLLFVVGLWLVWCWQWFSLFEENE